MKLTLEHFKADWERFSLTERLLLAALLLTLIIVWFVGPTEQPVKWKLPLRRHTLNYYMQK